jgi:hypothetical protein
MNKQTNAKYSKALRGMLFSWLALAFVLTAAPLAPAQAADAAFQNACKLYNSGKYRAAKEAFIDVLTANPDYWPARYQLANAYMQSGETLEASMEYEKVLEGTKDAKTRQNCLKALAYIKDRSGATFSPEAEKQLAANMDQTTDLLSKEGQKRLMAKESQMEKERNEIIQKARVKASHIRTQAKEQAAAQVAASNWYVLDHNFNLKPSLYPPGRELAAVDAANDKAEAIKEAAKVKAESMKPPMVDDVTENLKSQLKVNAAKAKFRMSPVGTNVYVRNYQSSPNKSNVAATSNSVK